MYYYQTCYAHRAYIFTGTVVAAFERDDPLLNKRVFLVPMRGWEKDPYAPESPK